MTIRYTKAKSLIFDGPESEILDKSFNQAGISAPIRFDDFANNNFEDLQQVINNDDFESIVKTGGFVPDRGFLNLYKNSDGLRLYYYKKNNTIIVLAYGEFQPGRYMLYMEGVWLIDIA
ncbi:MAG: hypothetical protein JWR09_3340 [Mucilaginibacter sp.]|nr:hypothetical protein [Mucilaginibacter sp.]